ncbi:MAG: hypothetical protein KatS3mg126_2074 [Lysobacteraceae bacterium]|nr:MAG: hypothetical protein KatS3mg126_2074 [Xanthomonadaceae bacterium]
MPPRQPLQPEENDWARRLAELPEAEPSPLLDRRIREAARRAARPARRRPRWLFGASAAALLALMVAVPGLRRERMLQPTETAPAEPVAIESAEAQRKAEPSPASPAADGPRAAAPSAGASAPSPAAPAQDSLREQAMPARRALLDRQQAGDRASSPEAAGRSQASDLEAAFARIRSLRDAGRIDEAREALARLRARVPDLVLPADLEPLRETEPR